MSLDTLGGTIGTAQIADDAVTADKIGPGAVVADGIGPGAVIGNWVFGDPTNPDTWIFGIPSIWAWQILFWVNRDMVPQELLK